MQNVNLLKVTAGSGINQIRGINRSGATGAGIPAHVTNVSTSMANASSGSTSTVSVTFRRDPSDLNFGGVTVWVKGYQGNLQPTQVASGTDSPINFILNNTGEALSVTVQANGNGGSAPISTAPTAGLTLPKSSSGGAGTTTTTSGPTLKTNGTSNSSQSTLNLKNGNAITVTSGAGGDETIALTSANIALAVPAEFSVSGSPVTNGAGGTITISKATETANTVWAGPISGSATQPTFRALNPFDFPFSIPHGYIMRTNGGQIQNFGNTALTEASSGTTSNVTATTTEYALRKYTTSAVAGNGCVFGENLGFVAGTSGVPAAYVRRFVGRVVLSATTNIRAWVGMGNLQGSAAANFLVTNPNGSIVGFRYVAGVDTNWTAYSGTATAVFTATDTGVAPSTTATQLLQVDFDTANSALRYFIDGALVATIGTTIPTTVLRPQGSVDNLAAAVAGSLSWAYLLSWAV